MIKGENITLRVVLEKDLDTLFRYYSDIDDRGEFFPIWLPSEAVFKNDFKKHGFWGENQRRLVIVDKEDTIVGSIWFFTTGHFFQSLHCNRESYRHRGVFTQPVLKQSQSELEQPEITAVAPMDDTDPTGLLTQRTEIDDPDVGQAGRHQ